MTFGKPVSARRENEQLYFVKISANPMGALGPQRILIPKPTSALPNSSDFMTMT